MSKVSNATFVDVGLGGPKGRRLAYPMDYWFIFQFLFVIVISWGGTKLDSPSGMLKLYSFNQ